MFLGEERVDFLRVWAEIVKKIVVHVRNNVAAVLRLNFSALFWIYHPKLWSMGQRGPRLWVIESELEDQIISCPNDRVNLIFFFRLKYNLIELEDIKISDWFSSSNNRKRILVLHFTTMTQHNFIYSKFSPQKSNQVGNELDMHYFL